MKALLAALDELGITAGVELNGRWVTIRGERGAAYVIEAGWGDSFYVWCDIPEERSVTRYRDPIAAIREGLRRTSGQPRAASDDARSGAE